MRFKLTILFVLAVVILAWFSYKQIQPPFENGETVPLFSLPDIEGNNVKLEVQFGKPLLIHFWATWCPQCIEELPMLAEFQKDHTDIKVLAVSEDEDISNLKNFFKNGTGGLTILQDADGKVADSFKSYKVPETFLVNKEGKFLYRFIGAVEWNDPKIWAKIQSLIK